jgi:polyketide synthase PksM
MRINEKCDIAIIGVACRFPGADNYKEFWENLKNGVNSIKEIPAERWDINTYYSPKRKPNKSISKWYGLLNNFDKFDNEFFNISPKEAEQMDPQQRLLLEEAWHCIENSGISLKVLQKKKTDVYVGVADWDYLLKTVNSDINSYTVLGNHSSILSNRISYILGLNGASMSLDTACSSSLFAIKKAKDSLFLSDADYALVASACVHNHPLKYISFSNAHISSPDGQCKTFDKDANGFVLGDGIGILLLQRLDDAIRENNNIFGVIKGIATNHVGSSSSLTTPSIEAQEKVISSAYKDADIRPDTINFIEAHGTGTYIGDPMEVEALTKVFRRYSSENHFCKLGSVKTNIGHTGGSAGMAGVIKVLMMMHHKKIPPNLNFKTPNPVINFEDSPFCVPTTLSEWKSKDKMSPLRAGVSAFGFGGANAHLVLESPPTKPVPENQNNRGNLFLFSAKSEVSLEALVNSWQTFIRNPDHEKYSLKDISATMISGREIFPFRFGFIADHLDELKQKLNSIPNSYSKQDNSDFCLRIGEYDWKRWQDVQPFLTDNTYFEQETEQIEALLKELNVPRSMSYGFRGGIWMAKYYKLYRFMASYVFLKTLIKTCGVVPDLVAGDPNNIGFWTALTISGIVKCEDTLGILSGKKDVSDIEFARPYFSFYDPVSKKIINPFYFDAEYIQKLLDNIKISDNSAEIYLSKTTLLLENQFTFKKLIEEWDTVLEKTGKNIRYIINNKTGLFDKEKILFNVIASNCIRKMNQKWNLSDKQVSASPEFFEIVDLITDNVMSKETAVEIFRNDHPDLETITALLNRNQRNININNSYDILKKQKLNEISDRVRWLNDTKNKTIITPDNLPCIDFGRVNKDIALENIGDPDVLKNKFILKLWQMDLNIDLKKHYPLKSYQKVPLPVYPFKGERHWLLENNSLNSIEQSKTETRNLNYIHPLLHKNTSDFSDQCFNSIFTGQEFFLADHVVNGKKVLPGVAYLEMVRVAVDQAVGLSGNEKTSILLKNVVWARPITLEDQSVNVNIRLLPEENESIVFEIHSFESHENNEPLVHSQGIVILTTEMKPFLLNIQQLKKECQQNLLTSDACYQSFEKIGLNYGVAHRGIEKIYVGEGKALAKLTLPSSVSDTLDEFMIHPGLADAALQVSIAMRIDGSGRLEPELPFALDRLEIYKKCDASMWAFVQYTEEQVIEDRFRKVDIDLCDNEGNICLRMQGFTSVAQKVRTDVSESLLLIPSWTEQPADPESYPPGYDDHIVILCEKNDSQVNLKNIKFVQMELGYSNIDKRFCKYALKLFEDIQKVFHAKNKGKILLQIIIPNRKDNQLLSGLSGLLKTAHLENPNFIGQIIEIDENVPIQFVIQENSRQPNDDHIRYQSGKRLVKNFRKIEQLPEKIVLPWKDKGIYLITGGAGGLGLIFANEIADQVEKPVLILNGRSELTEKKYNQLKKLEDSGAIVEYILADVNQKEDVQNLLNRIKQKFGSIDGIIHAAGIILDNYIIKKTKLEFEKVIASKVTGLTNIDTLSKDFQLDFFVMFSSFAGTAGSVGQADYSCANAFMEAYASYRNDLVKSGKRNGKTLAINWPLWKDGGMQVDKIIEKSMKQRSGMIPINTETGIQMFYQGLSSHHSQIMAFQGNLQHLLNNMKNKVNDKEVVRAKKSISDIADDSLIEKAENYFKSLLSSTINIPSQKIETNAPMEKYGIDSIMVLQLTEVLEKSFGSLSKTLFFEYQTLGELTGYFLESYREKLIEEIGILDTSENVISSSQKNEDINYSSSLKAHSYKPRSRFAIVNSESQKTLSEDIAIIGLSGRYPKADNVNDFWINLRDGKDCISEIPQNRWDHSLYFDSDKEKIGKTYSKWGGFINDVDKFDPLFFNISPREAELMDPQERLFLECVYETLEDAGYTKQALSLVDKVGVYVGVMYEEYQLYGAQEQILGRNIALGGSTASIANRVSYFLNLQGPSMALDTMCSSSITAIHLACQSIKMGECKVAVAGGVNVSVHPNKYLMLAQGRYISSKGRCESFGHGGDGYVPGEGVGAILLKPLSLAISDDDQIYGVIKGCAVNHDGKTNGFTVPNPNAQANVIEQAIKEADIDPRKISYLEAHGTGTSLGDPIEITGLNKAFRKFTNETQFCAIGSAKSNIGHCESAAGIAGVTKILLQFRHKKLVPSLHSRTLNPNIDFDSSPFVVQHELSHWKCPVVDGVKTSRIAGVSSFGAGGANAHIILEEYRRQSTSSPALDFQSIPAVFVLSAKNEDRLKLYAKNMAAFLEHMNSHQSVIDSENKHLSQHLIKELVMFASDILTVDESDIDCDESGLFNHIFDHMSIVKYCEQINKVYDLKLSEQIILDFPTIRAFSHYLIQEYHKKIVRYFSKNLNQELAQYHLNDDYDLWNIAYTLQIGREPMEERLALTSTVIDELCDKLKKFADGNDPIENFYRGNVKQHNIQTVFDDDMVKTVDTWIAKGTYSKLLAFWVKGGNFDWNRLYPKIRPRRVSLPTYPFLKDRFWIDRIQKEEKPVKRHNVLHPMLHENTSDLDGYRFSSTFTGNEFFLTDHVVKGQKILPGVAYLEMVRAAVEQISGGASVSLKDVVWTIPIAVNDPIHVHINLLPEDSGEIVYEIYSISDSEEAQPVVHSSGIAMLNTDDVPTLDIKDLQDKCNQKRLGSDECYEFFEKTGLEYGVGFRGIKTVDVSEDQALAKLLIPDFLLDTVNQYFLHPCLADSALQTSISLTKESELNESSLPYSIDRVDIYSTCTSSMWANVRFNDQSGKLDIDLCDEKGLVCTRMQGLFLRTLKKDVLPEETFPTIDNRQTGPVMLSPVWNISTSNKEEILQEKSDRILIVGGNEKTQKALLQRYNNAVFFTIQPQDTIETIVENMGKQSISDHIIWFSPYQSFDPDQYNAFIEAQEHGVILLFRMIKAVLLSGFGSKNLNWTIITVNARSVFNNDPVNPCHASIHGLVGAMAKEYPNWKVRLADVESEDKFDLENIFFVPPDSQGNARFFRNNRQYIEELIPVNTFKPENSLYREKGVYVVIGGAGGIGAVWTQYMIRNYQAQVIWIGRRKKDKNIEAALKSVGTPEPLYLSTDASDLEALQKAYEEIKGKYLKINGVIHSAIVLSDKSLMNMDEDRFRASLSAKVDVSVRMVQVFGKEPLDFMLFFSSMQSFAKSAGQSNYAAGCTFKDSFATKFSLEADYPVKIINWGYWGSIGSVASKEYQNRMAAQGIESIESIDGMAVLEKLLTVSFNQIAYIKISESFNWQGITTDESITVSSQHSDINIKNIQYRIPEPDMTSINQSADLIVESETILFRLMQLQLQNAGLFTEKKKTIIHLYDKWFQAVDILTNNSEHKTDTSRFETDSLWEEWEQKKQIWPKNSIVTAQTELVEASLRALPEIITGRIPATDIIFPNGSMELVERVYKNNDLSDYLNTMVADLVLAYTNEILQKNEHHEIRIFEIGAGTGSASHAIFEKLKTHKDKIKEYCYTDISKAFLIHAEEKYGKENPYLSYQIYDVEKSHKGQGIEKAGYDIVIAANVLHATRNIRQTLSNAKALMKNNGILILNELAANSLFFHLTFGLLEGWWLSEDSELRIPGSPILSPETWCQLLEHERFTSIWFPAENLHDLGHQIIVAKSDGIIRQKNHLIQPKAKKESAKPDLLLQETKHATEKVNSLIPDSENNNDLLREKSTEHIKRIIGEVLKVPVQEIDSTTPLEQYGMDSIMVNQCINSLRKIFENISSTLFFEYQTVDELVTYFMQTQKKNLIKLTGLTEPVAKQKVIDQKPKGLPVKNRKKIQKIKQIRTVKQDKKKNRDIAIIGLSGCYPQAESMDQFWNNLKEGKNCITEIPKNRWDWKKYFDEEKGKTGFMYTRWGGFIDDIDKFDPLFFNISPVEAESMDPQERMFLKTAYSCIQDAGYTPQNLSKNGKVGVFVGVMNNNYPSGVQHWSIANRISYLLNFHGPSIALDTACSSALTAIHSAAESLYSGTSECVIAGGVNLIIDPVHYIRLNSMQMVASDHRNKSFGTDADGFVPGEGVGAILMKPLQKAIDDRDHIYGIIKATHINACGKTSGYTVPNLNAQSELIAEALKSSVINPRTISYIEAHGTGTSLGDPIEIAGLTKAFEKYTQDKQFCAIGSVKSNIGHCESASGISGITKILLQLKYEQIAPSLHSDKLNPEIDFKNTPFTVQQKLSHWKRPLIDMNGRLKEYPRIAGLSSFGAGGANAHVIIEEYIEKSTIQPQNTIKAESAIFVLSAKNHEQLMAYAIQMRKFLSIQYSSIDINDIAYTSQTGRIPMEERLAVIVQSVESLKDKLNLFIDGNDTIEDFYRGSVKQSKGTLKLLETDEEFSEMIEKWIKRRKYSKLLKLWVKGLEFDWNILYQENRPRRISLPTYPFAKERYWIPASFSQNQIEVKSYHPFIDILLPVLPGKGLTFQKTFSSNDPIIDDYNIKGLSIFPDAGFLEMAYAAISQVQEIDNFILEKLVWLTPVSVQEANKELNIVLKQLNTHLLEFEIQSNGKSPVTHFKGRCLYHRPFEKVFQRIPFKKIAEKFTHTMDQETFYHVFEKTDFKLGPYFRGIKQVWTHENEALCQFHLPQDLTDELEDFTLHPVPITCAANVMTYLYDKEFQKNIGISSVGSIRVFYPLKAEGYVYIQILENNHFNVAVTDDTGLVRAKLYDVALDELQDPFQQFFYKERWKTAPLDRIQESGVEKRTVIIIYTSDTEELKKALMSAHSKNEVVNIKLGRQNLHEKHYEIQTDDKSALDNCIRSFKRIDKIYFLGGIDSGSLSVNDLTAVMKSQEKGVISLFRIFKSLIRMEIKHSIDVTIVTAGVYQVLDKESLMPFNASISGLARVAATENPEKLKIACVDINGSEKDFSSLAKQIIAEPYQTSSDTIAIRNGKRYIRIIERETLSPTKKSCFKQNGVYMIIGGAGGIGLEIANYLTDKYQVRLVLTGRKKQGDLNSKQKSKIKHIASKGSDVIYLHGDISNPDEMDMIVNKIISQYGQINGVIHAAAVIKDMTLMEMDEQNFCDVLDAKIYGSMVLSNALKEHSLDFMLFFSSVSGSVYGVPGQSNYGAANAFKNSFALYLDQKLNCSVKAINWGYWGKTGFGIAASDKIYNQLIAQGIYPINVEEGMEAIERILCSDSSQIIAVKAKQMMLESMGIERKLNKDVSSFLTDVRQSPKALQSNVGTTGNLRKRTEDYLKGIFANVLKLKQKKIENDVIFGNYGINSLMTQTIIFRLDKHFGKLPITLLLQYKTINELIDYFLSTHQEKLIEILEPEMGVSVTEDLFSDMQDSIFDQEIPFDKQGRACDEQSIFIQTPCHDNKSIDFVDSLTEYDVKRLLTSLDTDKQKIASMFTEEKSENKSLTFMFPGLGDHYINMGKGLYQTEKTFREQIDICCEIANSLLHADLKSIMYSKDNSSNNEVPKKFDLKGMLIQNSKFSDSPLNQINFTHCAVFTVEYALAKLWMERGLNPESMIGLSLGEYTAACLAGVMSLEDSLRILVKRAQLIEKLPEGAMLATLLSEENLQPILGNDLDIGVIGTPYSCMVSGNIDAITVLEKKLQEKEMICKRMQVIHAFHSKEMAPIGDEFKEFLKTVSFNTPQIPYISNVTGSWITDELAVDPEYWFHHICKTVRFADGISELLKNPKRVFLEVGPGQGLCSFVFQHPEGEHFSDHSVLHSLRNENDHQADEDLFSETLQKLEKLFGIN